MHDTSYRTGLARHGIMSSLKGRIADFFYTSRLARSSVIVLLVMLLCLATWATDRRSLHLQLLTYAESLGFIANSVPVVLLFFLILVVSRRVIFTSLIVSALLGAVYRINAIKLETLQQPIAFSDIYFLRQVNASVIHLLSHYLSARIFLFAVVSLMILGGLYFWERPLLNLKRLPRIVIALLLALVAFGLYRGVSPAHKLYDRNVLRIAPWAPAASELHAGLLGTLVYQAIESSTALREPVDNAAIAHLARLEVPDAGTSSPVTSQKPDIIVIQSESYFDPSTLAGIDDTSRLLPVLARARLAGSVGHMRVPTFGGGTLRTEFETLTSVPLAAFPKIEFPYLQIHDKTMPSLVRVLKKQGYLAYAVHPNDANFWNRDQAFQSMGFDAFYSRKDFPADAPEDGWAIADSSFTEKLEQLLDRESRPVFIMGISMEGHGPYLENPVLDKAMRDSIPAPSTWPENASKEYRNYAYHIHHADHELGCLWDYLEQRKRPYILVFYGDHLPGFSKVYTAAGGFDDHQPASTQMVPWVMVSNLGLKMPTQPIYSWMTGGTILCSFAGQGNDYYAMVQKAQGHQAERRMASLDRETLEGIESLSRLYLRGEAMPRNVQENARQSFCAATGVTNP